LRGFALTVTLNLFQGLSIKNNTMNEIETHIANIRKATTSSCLTYQVWWFLSNDENRLKYVDTMRIYNDFFITTVHANFLSTIVTLYGLYEKNGRKHTIPNCITLLEKEGRIDQIQVKNIKAKLDKTKKIRDGINILRNRVFAHKTAEGTQALFKKANLKPENLKELIQCSEEIINDITYIYDRTSTVCQIKIEKDVVKILEDLSKFNEPDFKIIADNKKTLKQVQGDKDKQKKPNSNH